MKILIVEDEIRILEGVKNLVQKLDDENTIVGEATDGAEGLRLLIELKPDVVITDIEMPSISGLEMLTKMVELNLTTKAIVLSAYSEFEYARRAIKLGVTEYLLKPISVSEFQNAFKNIKAQIKLERDKKPTEIGTLKQIFLEFVNGSIKMDGEVEKYLNNKYDIYIDTPMLILVIYLGSNYESEIQNAKRKFNYVLSIYNKVSYEMIDSMHEKSITVIMYNYGNAKDLERWLQHQVLNKKNEKMVLSIIEANSINEIKNSENTLLPYRDWNISLDHEIIISYPKITNIKTVPYMYKIELENKVKAAICAMNFEDIIKIIAEFQESFQTGQVYAPKDIKEQFVRFFLAIIGTSKEVGILNSENFNQHKFLEMIMESRTKEELMEVSDFLLENISIETYVDDKIHIVVKRMLKIIHEDYDKGIKLEEISIKLQMTPEYLGTLFHKEMGVTFNTYIRDYRIAKAKALICGTSMKVYEISESVGYSDPKYFSKVFRDTTGQLPAEYRKSYK